MKIAVVGDLLVDSGHFGTAAGGAARAASLLARTGNNVQLLTVLPGDSSPSQLAAVLPGVSVAAGQDLTEEMLRCLDFADAIMVADGGRGVTWNDRLRWRLGVLASSVPIVWDQHRDGPAPVPGVSAVTIGQSSASHASGIDVRSQDSASEAAGVLLHSWDASSVSVLTSPAGADSGKVRGTFSTALAAGLAQGMAVSDGVHLAAQHAGISNSNQRSLGLAFAPTPAPSTGETAAGPGS
ncbi:hypothetical protein F8G81_02660 [Arthrobacter sp. CDRTa11]|uniref:hypothetical protein n=1 Tax=Arthrobacter sp. CDRTa11 TaxID=2651199 RepID=UPI002265AA03|nr:hypothetical protein [Arthrobacter sp. CDRTa11]UZX01648.1 hypothetical protein F8G81_02660 [Arthrobacter sp. CDRTa11]